MDERKDLGKFLEAVVNIFDNQQGLCDEKLLEESMVFCLEYYNRFVCKNEHFYRDLLEIMGGDEVLYSIILSTIYAITSDARAIISIEDVLADKNVDVFWADIILAQITYIRFVNNIPASYKKRRIINQKMLSNYLNKYPVPYAYTPYQERNSKRIMIETDILLGTYHAPTYIVLEMCKSLHADYGYEIFLVVNRAESMKEGAEQYWYKQIKFNYNSDMENEFLLEYEGAKIRGFQFEWNRECLANRNAVLDLIDRWKPLCVFHVGAYSYRHDIYKEQTTLISMPCNAGFIVSEAQVLFSYMNDNSEYMKDAVKYIQNQGQLIKSVDNFGNPKVEIKSHYRKTDFGLPEDAFVACIVGNRLNEEMSDEFIHMLETIGKEKKELHLAIVGECRKDFFASEFKDKVVYLGYQNNLPDVLNVMDLFVNPIRKGGGGGANLSLQVGVPVITVRDCDVHSVVGDAFGCDSLEAMKKNIVRYVEDKDFYDAQVQESKVWSEKQNSVNRGELFYQLIQDVEKELKEGRIK